MADFETTHGGTLALFQAVARSSSDAIVGITTEGVVGSWNPAATALYGYRAEEMIGRNADVLVEEHLRAQEGAVLRRVVAGGHGVGYETTRVTRGGSLVGVTLTMAAVADAVDQVVGVVLVSRSLSPAVAVTATRAERDVQDAQLQQTQRMEVLGRLAGGIAHDFNNLLAVISNYADFIAEEVTLEAAPAWSERREGVARDVAQIQRAAERAADLTHQLLAFARRDVIQPRVLDLNFKVAEVEELLRRTLGDHVELVTTLTEDIWPVLAAPGQIAQVLVNLAINARDAMTDGGQLIIDTANVFVDAESVDGGAIVEPGRYVRVRVSDNGPGMPDDVIDHAFEPFFTTKSSGAGTGLGLATVFGIVSQASGSITVASQVGLGCTFTILLPVTDEVAVADAEPMFYERVPKGETILVVEDEDALRTVTERIFVRNGYKVLTAANGADALALLAAHTGEVHLLVTNVIMPNMLGKEVAERVRALRPSIEVLFMSGYARPVLAAQGRLEPGVALIDKPFTEISLLAKAGEVLNGHFGGFQNVRN